MPATPIAVSAAFPGCPPPPGAWPTRVRLARGLTAAAQAGIRYVCLTGGEPLLYPDLPFCLARTRALGLTTLLVTNGALLTAGLIEALGRAGLDTLIVSIDAASEQAHDRHRGIPGLASHIRDILPRVHEAAIRAVASVTISRLIDDMDEVVRFVRGLGFEHLTFSYPLTRLHSTYLGFAASDLVTFAPGELDRLFTQILEIKERSPVNILNPRVGLEEARRQLQGLPSRFPCTRGLQIFFCGLALKRPPLPLPGRHPGPLGRH